MSQQLQLSRLGLAVTLAVYAVLGFSGIADAQTDPGPRPLAPAGTDCPGAGVTGGSLLGLTNREKAFFCAARERFQEVDSVSNGLGPRFNLNSCAGCHAFPAIGGSGPNSTDPQAQTPNPQIAVATLNGATNKIPKFITSDGPIREARFVFATAPSGEGDREATHGNGEQGREDLDGGVHDLYTITGRTDAPAGCNLKQPDFATELAKNNVVFRIPTPLFGLGLVEDVPDNNLVAAQNQNKKLMDTLGIVAGKFNHSGNDGTITRFGWKAQNKSLLIFAGEAYNVEQGVTNELFPNKRDDTLACQVKKTPEDATNLLSGSASDVSSDTVNFAAFMRLSAPPTLACTPTSGSSTTTCYKTTASKTITAGSVYNGLAQFTQVGCGTCHVPTQTTRDGDPFHPYSDFALHSMGDALADGIIQGNAAKDEFRTAPLWGIGQRIYFLHDGRTYNLLEAIQAHKSDGSEANTVIDKFNKLTATQKQDILNFLRSL